MEGKLPVAYLAVYFKFEYDTGEVLYTSLNVDASKMVDKGTLYNLLNIAKNISNGVNGKNVVASDFITHKEYEASVRDYVPDAEMDIDKKSGIAISKSKDGETRIIDLD